MADVIDYQIFGDDLQLVEIELDNGEGVRAEAGTLHAGHPHSDISARETEGNETRLRVDSPLEPERRDFEPTCLHCRVGRTVRGPHSESRGSVTCARFSLGSMATSAHF